MFVIDAQGRPLEVPYRDLGKVPVSLRELQRATAQLRQEGGASAHDKRWKRLGSRRAGVGGWG